MVSNFSTTGTVKGSNTDSNTNNNNNKWIHHAIYISSLLIVVIIGNNDKLVEAKSNHNHHNRLHKLQNIESRIKEFTPPSVPLFTSTTSLPISIPSFFINTRGGSSGSSSSNNGANVDTNVNVNLKKKKKRRKSRSGKHKNIDEDIDDQEEVVGLLEDGEISDSEMSIYDATEDLFQDSDDDEHEHEHVILSSMEENDLDTTESSLLYQEDHTTHDHDTHDTHGSLVEEDQLEENDLNHKEEAEIIDSSMMEYAIENDDNEGQEETLPNTLDDGDEEEVVIDDENSLLHGGYDDETIIGTNNDEEDDDDNIHDDIHDDSQIEEGETNVDVILDDMDIDMDMDYPYPSGSDSAAFVDRMDLADAYDDGIFTDIMGDTDMHMGEDESGNFDVLSAEDMFNESSLSTSSSSSSPNVPPRPDNRPTVQYIITENMRRCLIRQLGYSPLEVSHMKPDVAAVVVSKMLKRPEIGMPSKFYVDGTAPVVRRKIWGSRQQMIVRRVILPAIITGFSIYFGTSFINSNTARSFSAAETENEAVVLIEDEAKDNMQATDSSSYDSSNAKNYDTVLSKSSYDTNPSTINTEKVSARNENRLVAKKENKLPARKKFTLSNRSGDDKKSQVNKSTKDNNIDNSTFGGEYKKDDETSREESLEDSDELEDTIMEVVDKSIIDKAIIFTLEKIDETLKRPF